MQNYGIGNLNRSISASFRSILVCRTDRMGDVILALPAARALKLTYPDARIAFLCRKYTAPLLSMCPWSDGVIEVDQPIAKVLERIKEHRFDAAVCLWQEPAVVRLLVKARIPLRVGPGTRIRSIRFHRRLFEHRKWALRHEVYYNLNIARLAGIDGIPDPLWAWDILPEAKSRIDKLLMQSGLSGTKEFVVLHSGSGKSANDWSLDRFGGLAKRLKERGMSVLLTGSLEEKAPIERIGKEADVPNAAGELTIPELAALFRRAALVVANSTGPLHLANALGTRVIGLYPLTRSMHPRRWGPLGQLENVVTPESKSETMASISVDRVAKLADDLTGAGGRTAVVHWHKPPPLSVLITITCPWWNAAVYLAIGLAAGLKDRGHEVWVMGRPGTPALNRADDLGLRTIGLPLHKQDPVSVIRNVGRIREILRNVPVTLVNAHCPMGHSQVGAALLGMGRNTPMIRTVCDPRPPKEYFVNRWLHRQRTDAVVVTCDASRQRYLEVFPSLSEKVYVIPGGIDPTPFLSIQRTYTERQSRELWIGVISRLSPVKGHEVFLKAAALVAAKVPEVRFLISGEEAQLSHSDLRGLAESLGISERVTIEDRVDDVRTLLRRIDIGVVPSVGSEAMCRIAMEMMASGLPVVGTSVNAVGETITDGVTGFVVPPNDPDELAIAILKLVGDSNLQKRMGQAGRERVSSELSMDRMVERTEELYRSVLSQRSSEYMPVIGEVG